MEILAHRTGSSGMCPNSRWGLAWSSRAGACGIECDVTFVDDEPFLWLPEMRSRICGLDRDITLLSAAAVRKFRRSDCSEEILHIEDVWDFLQSHRDARVYFDVKYYGADVGGNFSVIPHSLVSLAVERLAQSAPFPERIGFTTFLGGRKLLHAVKRVHERITTDLIVVLPGTGFEECKEYLSSLTIGWKHINHWRWVFPGSAERIVARARTLGLRRYAGLCNTFGQIRWAAHRDFDALWTDDVSYARYAMQQTGGK